MRFTTKNQKLAIVWHWKYEFLAKKWKGERGKCQPKYQGEKDKMCSKRSEMTLEKKKKVIRELGFTYKFFKTEGITVF